MRKIFMLAIANIRKTKGHTVSLFIMFFIAALLLNTGLLVAINFGSSFDETLIELNTTNMYYVMPADKFDDEVRDYIKNHENVLEYQEEASLWASGIVEYNGTTRGLGILMNDAEEERKLSKWKFIGEHLPPEEMSIYLPYVFNISGGYELNDNFELVLDNNGEALSFTIKGFVEDIFFSSVETGLMGTYLPHDTYEIISEKLDEKFDSAIIYTDLRDINKDIEFGIIERTKLKAVTFSTGVHELLLSFDIVIIESSRVMMAVMMSVMIVVFAFIIVTVCLIVVRFRIGNSIEDDMIKIGSLKAIGYTSRQIVYSIVMQFLLVAFIGVILGISASYMITPAFSDIFAHQSGFKWIQGFDMDISSLTLAFILIIVIIVAYITARKIKKLSPIVALRGGIATHSFRKNHMGLDKAKGSLPIVLALKNLLQNKKQSIMITIIMFAISFTGTFAVIMFYNTTVDTKTFNETPGIELCNTLVNLKPNVDGAKITDEIRNLEGVRKVQFIDETTVKSSNYEVRIFVMEDYSGKETDTIYRGRYPIHSNEIAIAGHLAQMLDKNIGDKISLMSGELEEDYLITGLTQGAYMGGINASIRLDGIIKIIPEFVQQSLQIYLKGVDAGVMVKRLEELYKAEIISITDMDKSMEEGTGVYTAIISKIGMGIFVITIAVVILVLYFVINSSVTRRKRELGIQKAIGYTTIQLMNQISLGFLPSVLMGVLIGSLVGATETNAVMSMVQRGMGIMKADYIVVPIWVISFGIITVVVSYMVSMLLTYRIRKISAYTLVAE